MNTLKPGDMCWVERGVVYFHHLENLKERTVSFRHYAEHITGEPQIVLFLKSDDNQDTVDFVILMTRYGLRTIQSAFVHPMDTLPR